MNFTISELIITGTTVPIHVADKLLLHHIWPMMTVREIYGKPIYASQQSGYRPEEWELQHGRSGNSQHTFKALGAIDWRAEDLDKLMNLIIQHTAYNRMCRYENFIHCDYKEHNHGGRAVYKYGLVFNGNGETEHAWIYDRSV